MKKMEKGYAWKIHLFIIMTATLKLHHWKMAKMDRKTVHEHNLLSSIFEYQIGFFSAQIQITYMNW